MRSAMRAASQLPGRGPTVVIWPLYLQANKKSDDDDPRHSSHKGMSGRYLEHLPTQKDVRYNITGNY